MARYHGKTGVVYMSTTGSGTAGTVIALSEWSLDYGADTADVSAFGDTNKQYVQGLTNITGTLQGFWDDTNDTLFDGADSADGVKMYLYPSSLVPTVYFYGPAWVNASLTTPVGGGVTVSANFVARGNWGRKP